MSDDEELDIFIHHVLIGDLYYDISYDSAKEDRIAVVVCQSYDESTNYPDLTSVVIPEKVIYDDEEYRIVSIGYAAFAFCSRLASVTLPKTLTKIEENAFWGCSSLTSIVVPDGVTVIEKNAFYDCPKLTTIELPDSLVSIGDRAFDDSEITSIRFPNSITQIGDSVFGCSRIPIYNNHLFAKLPHSYSGKYIVPEGIKTIAKCAFLHYVDKPFSIVLPESVTHIGHEALWCLDSLTSLTCKAIVPPVLEENVFNHDGEISIPVYVPVESIERYKAAPQWQQCTNIQPIPNS